MKQAMTLFLCACALPTALLLPHARAEGVITLKSGEKLPGSLDTLDSASFTSFFRWVSSAVSTGSRSQGLAESAPLPPPPAEIQFVI